MRRAATILTVIGGALLGGGAVSAGDLCREVVWCDGFDEYEPGILIGQDCGPAGHACDEVDFCPPGLSWQPWDLVPEWGESVVVDDPFRSAPHAVEVKGDDDLVHTYRDLVIQGGLWEFSANLYIPDDYTGETYFILLNTYTDSNDANWSTQVHFHPDGDRVISDFDDGVQNDVRFARGAWKQLRVLIDLDAYVAPGQWIYYDDQLVIAKEWFDEIHGIPRLEALNLFANGSSPVYWDDFRICAVERVGACCLEDGTCLEDEDRDECADAGGIFQGFGEPCAGACPVRGPDGWELVAPFEWEATTCDPLRTNCEDVYEGPDEQFRVTIPFAADWTFSTCGSGLFDVEMLIGTTGLCSRDLMDRKDPGQDACDLDAVKVLFLREADTVYVDVESWGGECGLFGLEVTAACVPAGGDVDFDGRVDFDDVLLVLSHWAGPGPPGDANCDGVVDFDDLLHVLGNWS